MDDFYEFQTFVRTVLDRISKLETHIINLIHPIQSITQVLQNPNDIKRLIEYLSRPLEIDDRSLSIVLSEFRNCMREFREDMQKLDLSQTLGEIKFICKRIHEIENTLVDLKRDGVTRKVHLDFTVDGYEMVKKQVNFHPEDPIMEPNNSLKDLLNTLSDREKKVIIHRFGLFGEKEKTYDGIGKIFSVSRERIRQINAKAIRKLRHPSRSTLVDKITHRELRYEIRGEDERIER